MSNESDDRYPFQRFKANSRENIIPNQVQNPVQPSLIQNPYASYVPYVQHANLDTIQLQNIALTLSKIKYVLIFIAVLILFGIILFIFNMVMNTLKAHNKRQTFDDVDYYYPQPPLPPQRRYNA